MKNFDWLSKTKYFFPLSVAAMVVSICVIFFIGLRPGVDFTGGTQFTVLFSQDVSTEEVRSLLSGIDAGGVNLSQSLIQDVGGARTKTITTPLDVETHTEVINQVRRVLEDHPLSTEVSVTSVGAQVSREIVNRAWQAILIAMVGMLIYISIRFRLRYAVGAIAALIHDVLIALGVFACLGVEINLPEIAAFLTIVGYSINDTIVIFDRVRENTKLMKKAPIYDVINRSINQSLMRTINTAVTTFFPILLLFILGGPVLRGFALAFLVGLVAGTYSTFYIANPILYWWTKAASSPAR